MKTKSFLLVTLFVCSAFTFSSCNDDDNYTPDDVVVNSFNTKYPDAKRVEWEIKAGYKVADFYLESKETEAWFENDGKWVMTETDLTFTELPQVIQINFKESKYASWKIDDVDKLERFDTEVVYVIEVEQGETDIDLYYSEDGTLIKEVNENGNNSHEPAVIPDVILEEVKRMYPNAKFLDFEKAGSYLEIDILDGKVHRELLFNTNNEWLSTEWDVRIADVPAVVMDALKASEYKDYKIDDIDAFQKPDGLFYDFELELGNQEIHVQIKADGTIIKK